MKVQTAEQAGLGFNYSWNLGVNDEFNGFDGMTAIYVGPSE